MTPTWSYFIQTFEAVWLLLEISIAVLSTLFTLTLYTIQHQLIRQANVASSWNTSIKPTITTNRLRLPPHAEWPGPLNSHRCSSRRSATSRTRTGTGSPAQRRTATAASSRACWSGCRSTSGRRRWSAAQSTRWICRRTPSSTTGCPPRTAASTVGMIRRRTACRRPGRWWWRGQNYNRLAGYLNCGDIVFCVCIHRFNVCTRSLKAILLIEQIS